MASVDVFVRIPSGCAMSELPKGKTLVNYADGSVPRS